MIFALAIAKSARDPRSDSRNDQELIRDALAGDRQAFTTIYRRHVDRVFALMTRLIGPVPEREDLVQQVFVDLYRALGSFRGEAALPTFLYRIAARAAYDHLGKQRRRKTELGDEPAFESLVDTSAAPDEALRQRKELERAFALLGELKPKKRIAFVLVVIEGMSLREAASVLGASEDAVKQRVLHARKELQAMEERRRRREEGQ